MMTMITYLHPILIGVLNLKKSNRIQVYLWFYDMHEYVYAGMVLRYASIYSCISISYQISMG